MNAPAGYRSFAEFYPFYLREHSNRVCRWLHFTGTTLAVALLIATVVTGIWWLIPVGFVQGYLFAWIGHIAFEHNRPATFKHPWYSFLGDWRMWWDMLTGRVRF